MTTGLLIPADAAAPIQELTFAGVGDYRAVISDWTNDVWLERLGVTVHVDLGGIAKGLPLNIRASRLMWSDRPDLIDTVKLYGDAVLVGNDGSGEETDVPEAVHRALTEPGEYAVLLKVAGRPWELHSEGHEHYLEAITTGLVLMQCWPDAEDMRVLPAAEARQFLSSQPS
ncbi:hypothetical protein EJO69_02840 [Flaviflexus salsibiostraticola]|uniref:DUF3846 domain-containing protein n=1 Tax=Flaviflexus salsibiostraticola TaxID=1282737 RepID=A0A3S8Z769_9ACTO|nr:hypothetical protein [Flaviflexus salsibiostraticola]AZN29359.1 hypothetical protein EJO69_02840 [Flaviflexus salsibiostraticola]